ncbi:hypothetical protein ACSTLO_00505, partial [Vibrio parahaemolyticus]
AHGSILAPVWDRCQGSFSTVEKWMPSPRRRADSRHPAECRKLVGGDVSERPKVHVSKGCVG